MPRRPKRPRHGTQADIALTELEHLIHAGRGQKHPHHERIPSNAITVKKTDWKAACARKQLTPSDKPDSQDKAFERSFNELSLAALVGSYDGWVWIIGDTGGQAK